MIRRMALALACLSASFSVFAAEGAIKGDAAKGQATAAMCAGCHGPDGNAIVPGTPSLAGQHKDYIVKQLNNFKAAEGKPATRNNPIMNGMAAPLTEEMMHDIAAWFASQKLKPAVAKDEKLVAQGQKLWRAGDFAKGIPACAGCHGPAGAGLPAQYPRLAGIAADYTEAQLKAFRAGERANDTERVMQMIAAKMSDGDMKAVADYAAGLR